MPETDFGIPGMTHIMARPACQRIWHVRHAGNFGTLDMLGLNYLLLEPSIVAAFTRYSF